MELGTNIIKAREIGADAAIIIGKAGSAGVGIPMGVKNIAPAGSLDTFNKQSALLLYHP